MFLFAWNGLKLVIFGPKMVIFDLKMVIFLSENDPFWKSIRKNLKNTYNIIQI